jgi:hypothetical protein
MCVFSNDLKGDLLRWMSFVKSSNNGYVRELLKKSWPTRLEFMKTPWDYWFEACVLLLPVC